MGERLTTIKLKDIVPSDAPRKESWDRLSKSIQIIPPREVICLDHYAIAIVRTDSGLLAPRSGNHRVARILHLAGNPNRLVSLTIDPQSAGYSESVEDMIHTVREEVDIYTFDEYLSRCITGAFND